MTTAWGDGPTTDERLALAQMEAGICTPGPRAPDQRSCISACYLYRDALTYGDPAALEPGRVTEARAFLTRGCAAGDPVACASLSHLPDVWPTAEREAAARAIALCDAQEDKDSICESLGAAIEPTLPAAQPALRALRCARAVLPVPDRRVIAGVHPSPGGLRQAAGTGWPGQGRGPAEGGRLARQHQGCAPMARIYDKAGSSSQGVTLPGQDDPEAHLAALTTVPGLFQFALDVRAYDDAVLAALSRDFDRLVAQVEARYQVTVDLGPRRSAPVGAVDPAVRQGLVRAAEALGIGFADLNSPASHDAAAFAAAGVPMAMVFIRNENGSHNPKEHMELEDFLDGCAVMAAYLAATYCQ